MFAHQVIEDLKTTQYNLKPTDPVNMLLRKLPDMIRNTQKFHIGEMDDMIQLSKSLFGQQMFIDNNPIKLPYPKMWVDYTRARDGDKAEMIDNVFLWPTNKRAALITSLPYDFINIFFFWFHGVTKTWMIGNASYYCNVGAPKSLGERFEKISMGRYPEKIHNRCGVIPCPNINDNRFSSQSGWEAQVDEDRGDLTTIYTTLRLLNCKNIQAEKVLAPPVLNKQRRKAGKQELFDYHVLNVVVPSKKRGYHESTEPLSHNRVHLCRGHFKEYTAEHPLFGHYTGLYWWQPHVRGQNKDGVVMKDYEVKTR